MAGQQPYLTIYGKQYGNGISKQTAWYPVSDQTTWTAQQPVPEEENWRVYFQQRTQSDALLDAWMDAREYLTVSSELLASGGVDYSVLDRYRTADFVVVPSQVYGIAIEATHTYDRSAAVWDDIDGWC